MSLVKSARYSAGTILFLTVLVQPVFAQTSIGFENPGDNTNILEYRLPDWGYRTWDLGFDLNGAGGDSYRGDAYNNAFNRFSSGLDSRFGLFRESESRTYSLKAYVNGNYGKAHNSANANVISGHQLGGRFQLGGDWTRYLGDGPLSLRVAGSTNQSYTEDIQESRNDEGTDESRSFRRSNGYYANLGAGWGRVRDVTPLIRAQRLSERLTALGRDRLAPGQVREIARVLATEQGYRMVFDRPDKSFWRDVLEPLLDEDNPLSTYEIFYLRDILEEDVGPRGEGFEVRASVFYIDHSVGGSREDYQAIGRGPALDLRWVRNLTFDHQLTLRAGVDYTRRSQQVTRGDFATGDVGLSHLWTIADRYRWDTQWGIAGIYDEIGADGDRRIQRRLETQLRSEFQVFIENNLSLGLHVQGSNTQEYVDIQNQGYDERYNRRWSWSYGIGFQYYLDRVLY